MKKDSILLFGGGKETVYNLHKAHKHIGLLLYINYGQKAYRKEAQSLVYYSKKFKIPFKIVSLPIYAPDSIRLGVKTDSSDVPFRNPLFLSFAVNMAVSLKFTNIIIGSIKSTRKNYVNDGFSNFLDDFSKLASKLYHITFYSPSAEVTSKELVNELAFSNSDLSHLWFCEKSGRKHCGKCNKCTTFLSDNERLLTYQNTFGYKYLQTLLFPKHEK